jgi:hypothetical protein
MAKLKVYYEAIHPEVNDVTHTFTGVEIENCIDSKAEFEYTLGKFLSGDLRLFYREHILEECH